MSLENPQPEAEVVVLPPTDVQPKLPFLNDKVYNWLKWLSLIGLPAFSTFYLTVGLPNATQVVGYAVAVATFVGALLAGATKNYNSSDAVNQVGTIHVNETADTKTYTLDLGNTDPAVLERSQAVQFNVNR